MIFKKNIYIMFCIFSPSENKKKHNGDNLITSLYLSKVFKKLLSL